MPLSITLLGLSLLSACEGRPDEALTWRESWEFLGLDEDGGVVDVRIAVGNTGLLRGQGHLRADRYAPDRPPIHYRRDVAPVEVSVSPTREAVALGYDGLARGEDPGVPERWTLRGRDEEARVLLHADPVGATVEAEARPRAAWMTGGGQWSIEATVPRATLTGWLGAGQRGGLVESRGVVLHRGGDGQPEGPRTTVVVFGRQGMVALDLHGDQGVAWTEADGRLKPLALPEGPVHLDREVLGSTPHELAFPDGPRLRVTLDGVQGEQAPLSHLSLPEQRIAGWTGRWTTRSVHRGVATIDWGDGGPLDQGPALWLTVASDSWAPVERPDVSAPLVDPAGSMPAPAGGPPP